MAEAKYVIDAAYELKTYWYPREQNFEEHYDLITLKDDLKQVGMESFVGNDPRTLYQRALQLLTSNEIYHKIPVEGLNEAQISATTVVEDHLGGVWRDINRAYRLRGRMPWVKEMASFLLLTGWYAVTALFNIDKGTLVSEVWNPAEVYPEYGDDGLIRCVHQYKRSVAQAKSLCRLNGWPTDFLPPVGNVTVYDYWEMTDNGPANAVVMETTLVKDLVPLGLSQIPVIVGAVAGIPDRGSIKLGDADWKKFLGEGLLAANVPIYKNFNRQATFMQQILRDTATPRWKEYSTRDYIIDDPDMLTKRGTIIHMTPDEDIRPVEVPPIPVEVQSMLFQLQNMGQRGGFPWSMYGNVQQEISGYLNAQIVAASTGVLAPYHEAIQFVISEIDNIWLSYLQQDIVETAFTFPENYPSDRWVEVAYELAIPSDLIQRAAIARQLAPGMPLMSQTTVMDRILNLKDPVREQALIMSDQAMMNPVAQTLSLYNALMERAAYLRQLGLERDATRYERAADLIDRQLEASAGAPPSPGQPTGPSPPRGRGRAASPPPSQMPPEQIFPETEVR